MPLIFSLISALPELASLFRNHTVDQIASSPVTQAVVNIAKTATGQPTEDAAVNAIQTDPNVALKFKQAILDNQAQLATIEAQRQKDSDQADIDEENAMTERAAKLEGTAADLKSIPIAGPIAMFARGLQRPLIGYGTMYVDYMVFSGAWKLTEGPVMNAWWATNILVMAFLFGERAVKNLAPLITDMMLAKK